MFIAVWFSMDETGEAIKLTFNRQMGKQTVVHTHHGILFSNEIDYQAMKGMKKT